MKTITDVTGWTTLWVKQTERDKGQVIIWGYSSANLENLCFTQGKRVGSIFTENMKTKRGHLLP